VIFAGYDFCLNAAPPFGGVFSVLGSGAVKLPVLWASPVELPH
jgi:hypothetical protein